jgi:hypothetical protein
MRKAKSGDSRSGAMDNQRSGMTPKNVQEYLAGVPEPARGTLKKVARRFDPPISHAQNPADCAG